MATNNPTEEEKEAHLVLTELFTLEAEDDDVASDSDDGHDHALTASPTAGNTKNDETDETQQEATRSSGT